MVALKLQKQDKAVQVSFPTRTQHEEDPDRERNELQSAFICCVAFCSFLEVFFLSLGQPPKFTPYAQWRSLLAIVCVIGLIAAEFCPKCARMLLGPQAIKVGCDIVSAVWVLLHYSWMRYCSVPRLEVHEWLKWFLCVDFADDLTEMEFGEELLEKLQDRGLYIVFGYVLWKTCQGLLLWTCWTNSRCCRQEKKLEETSSSKSLLEKHQA